MFVVGVKVSESLTASTGCNNSRKNDVPAFHPDNPFKAKITDRRDACLERRQTRIATEKTLDNIWYISSRSSSQTCDVETKQVTYIAIHSGSCEQDCIEHT